MDTKQKIIEIADSMGFARTVIGSLEPLEKERAHYEDWLAKGHAASMAYLKRDPHFRTSPRLLYPQSRSAIVVSVSYYSEPPPDPGLPYGKVALYAVGLDYHVVIRAKLRELKARIEAAIGRELSAKAFTDDVPLYEQAYASRHGLGFTGKNTMVIGPKLTGSYQFIGELFTDLILEPDESYSATCGKCFRCAEACPTGAIEEAWTVNSNLCISYLTIENKGEIPVSLRSKIGRWVFGCDICQLVCPYNQRPAETPWHEFQPQAGKGHYIDLCDLLQINDETEFRGRFSSSALKRPKLRGLQRNALVVLGNGFGRNDTTCETRERIAQTIFSFAARSNDSMLVEHAAWSLAQESGTRKLLVKLLDCVKDTTIREAISKHC